MIIIKGNPPVERIIEINEYKLDEVEYIKLLDKIEPFAFIGSQVVHDKYIKINNEIFNILLENEVVNLYFILSEYGDNEGKYYLIKDSIVVSDLATV